MGLAIADEIVRSVGGRITLSGGRGDLGAGPGLCVRLSIPASS